MTYLLDTPTLSDGHHPRPNPGVTRWLAEHERDEFATSTICLGEMWRGLPRFGPGQRRTRLVEWLDEVRRSETAIRVLPVTIEVAIEWGGLMSSLEQAGQRPPVADSLIAATALVHNLTVVTRNTRDFERCGVPVLNPWTG